MSRAESIFIFAYIVFIFFLGYGLAVTHPNAALAEVIQHFFGVRP